MPKKYDLKDPSGNIIGSLEAPDDAPPEQVEATLADIARQHAEGRPFSKSAAAVRALGGMPGIFGPVPGAVGAGAAEITAEGIEKAQGLRPEGYSIPQILTQSGLGAVPGVGPSKAGPLMSVLKQAVGGGALAGGGEALTELAGGEPLDWGNITTAAGIGTVLGGGLAARTAQIRRRVARMKAEREGIGPALVEHPETKELVAPETLGQAPARKGIPSPGVVDERRLVGETKLLGPEPEVSATPGEIMEPRVKPKFTEMMVESARKDIPKAARALADTEASQEGRRLFLQLAEAFDSGTLSTADVLSVLDNEGMSIRDFLEHWKETVSIAGFQLGRLGNLRRELNLYAAKMPELQKALEGAGEMIDPLTGKKIKFTEPPGFWEVAYDKLKRVDDFTRGSIVAQTATTFRNIETQLGRYSLDALDSALQKSVLGEPIGNSADEMLSYLYSAMRGMNPKQVKGFAKILDKYTPELSAHLEGRGPATGVLEKFPVEGQKLIQLPAGEVTLGGRYLKFINTLNRFQENYFRRTAFDVKLRQLLSDAGMDVEKTLQDPESIPLDIVKKSVSHALELTFVAPPSGPVGKQMMQAWVALRPFGVSSITFPFPRFMINAYKFLTDFSPVAAFRLFGYHPERLMADPKRYAQVVSRMQLGTLMLGGALALRNDPDLRGPKWYQMRLTKDGPLRDMRALAPFGTFLFYAEAIRQMSEKGRIDFTSQDYVQGLLSINRLAGTGLVAMDMFRGLSPDKAARLFQDSIAQYVGRITVPGRTLKDILAGFSEEEATYRSTREPVKVETPWTGPVRIPMTAPALGNIPVASQHLPEMPEPMRPEPRRALNPLARQFGAPTQVELNPIESAVAELGIEYSDIVHSSGIREFDRLATDTMGKIVAGPQKVKVGNAMVNGMELVQSPHFQRADSRFRKLILKDFLSAARGLATEITIRNHPEYGPELWFRRQKSEIRQLLAEMPGAEKLLNAENLREEMRPAE